MRARLRPLAAPIAMAVLSAIALAWLGLLTPAFTDYELEAEPALKALVGGDFGGFAQLAPSYGGSLLLRAPFALAARELGGGDLALFRSIAIPCLIAGAVLGVVLYTRGRELGRTRASCWIALLLCAANPLTIRALETGHAEELLVGALCVGAMLAAHASRPLLTGLLLGLAVAAKPWAVLAFVPVMIMLPAGHARALLSSGAAAAAVLAPFLLDGADAATHSAVARTTGHVFQPWQAWWFLGEHGPLVTGFSGPKPGYRTPPDWISQVARPLTVLVPVALSLLLARRLRARPWTDALLLLALAFLLRCVLDPWNISYYELPFLLALVTWELHARSGPPVLSLAATLLAWLTLIRLQYAIAPDVQAAVFLAWSVPLAIAMAVRLFAPERAAALVARPARAEPLARQPLL